MGIVLRLAVINAVINLAGMIRLCKILVIALSLVMTGCKFARIDGVVDNLVIEDILYGSITTQCENMRTLRFTRMDSQGNKQLLLHEGFVTNALFNDLVSKLIEHKKVSDSLIRKDSIRVLTIDFDNSKSFILDVSDYKYSEYVGMIRHKHEVEVAKASKDKGVEEDKKSDEGIHEHNITMNAILISLLILVTVDLIYLIVKTSQMRRYRSEIRGSASDILYRIATTNKRIDPDKDLRDAMIRLGYDPKVVNDIMDEVNKEIK